MSTNQINAPQIIPAGQEDAASSGASRFEVAVQDADQTAVMPIMGPGSGFGFRVNWGVRHGQWLLTYNHAGITPRSLVFVAISEGAQGGPNAGKFIGSARFTVHNVAPRAGAVDILVDIDWNSNILLYADYFVYNP